MSSSAALIVASLIGAVQVLGLRPLVNHERLLELARLSEAKIGVHTGGMDQAASILSTKGTGLCVSFWPTLKVEKVVIPSVPAQGTHQEPDALCLVIANSLTTHNLAADAKRHYNLRVVETMIAARLLSQSQGLCMTKDLVSPPTLREVVGRYAGGDENGMSDERLELALIGMLDEVESVLGASVAERESGLSMDTIMSRSGMTATQFSQTYLEVVEIEADTFHIYKRAKHVLEEALRVLHFVKICRVAEQDAGNIQALGQLMRESHDSCRDLFDCSCEELDELVQVCMHSGAIGARMSG
jgi:galactokinase